MNFYLNLDKSVHCHIINFIDIIFLKKEFTNSKPIFHRWNDKIIFDFKYTNALIVVVMIGVLPLVF